MKVTLALMAAVAGAAWIWGGTFLGTLVVAALLDSVNPCAISVLLVTLAFLFSLGRSRNDMMKIGSFYIAGIFAVYVLVGLGILQALHVFSMPHFMSRLGAIIMIIFGLLGVINEFIPSFPIKLGIPAGAHGSLARLMERATLPGALLLGVLVGLCEFPCTGGPYLMVLGMLHDQGTYLRGLGYLVLYNLIFVSPLIVILLMAADQSVIDRLYAWKREHAHRMRLWGSIAMILLGAAIVLL